MFIFQISWDQHASHAILEQWVERAMHDEDVSGIGVSVRGEGKDARSWSFNKQDGCGDDALTEMQKRFVHNRINELDVMFGRALGCRASPVLKMFVQADNHLAPPVCLDKSKKKRFFAKLLKQQQLGTSVDK